MTVRVAKTVVEVDTSINLVSGQIANVLNSITNDLNNIRDDIGTLAEANSNIEQGIQDVMDIAERSYMLAITAIGVGAAGILIGTAATSSNPLMYHSCQL